MPINTRIASDLLFLILAWISSVPQFALSIFILFAQDLRSFKFKVSALHHIWYFSICIILSCLLENTHFLTEKHVSELLRIVATIGIHINISLHYFIKQEFESLLGVSPSALFHTLTDMGDPGLWCVSQQTITLHFLYISVSLCYMYYSYIKIYPNIIALFKCSWFSVLFILKNYILARNVFIEGICSLLSFNTPWIFLQMAGWYCTADNLRLLVTLQICCRFMHRLSWADLEYFFHTFLTFFCLRTSLFVWCFFVFFFKCYFLILLLEIKGESKLITLRKTLI